MTSMGPERVCTTLWLLAWCFCKAPNSGSGCLSFAYSWVPFPPIGLPCPASIGGFFLSFCISFCPVWLSSLGGLPFSEEETGKGSVYGERGDGGIGGVEGKLWLGCSIQERNLFSIIYWKKNFAQLDLNGAFLSDPFNSPKVEWYTEHRERKSRPCSSRAEDTHIFPMVIHRLDEEQASLFRMTVWSV